MEEGLSKTFSTCLGHKQGKKRSKRHVVLRRSRCWDNWEQLTIATTIATTTTTRSVVTAAEAATAAATGAVRGLVDADGAAIKSAMRLVMKRN